MALIGELKRRGVIRIGMAYAVVAWLLVQVADILLDAFEAPVWMLKGFVLLLTLGFPLALVLSWFFEFTSHGVVRESGELGEAAERGVLGRTLNVVTISILAAAVVLFAADKFWWRSDSGNPQVAVDDGSSLAVLPFENRSSLEEDAYFAAGIHDDLLTSLAQIDSLKVTSRTSVQRYRESEASIPEIARELGVNSILEGGVQRAGQQVRIHAQLIDADTDRHLWAESFDRELTSANLFAIQSEIARAIAAALQARLSDEEMDRLDRIPTQDLEAYEAYLRGRASLLERSMAAADAAVGHFETATQRDGSFAGAWAGLCDAWLEKYAIASDTRDFESAEAACEQALEIDAQNVEVLVALGRLYRQFGDYERAEAELRRALALDDDHPEALIQTGKVLALQGQMEEAESLLLQAAGQYPNYWPAHDSLFNFYRSHDSRDGRLEKAVNHAMRVVELEPDTASAWNNLGTAYHSLEQYGAAKTAWDRALELEPTRTAYTNRGLQYYYDGQFDDAVEMQLKATELAPNDHRVWGRLAESYRHAGADVSLMEDAYREAIRHAGKKLAINPRDWRTRAMLGLYQAWMGEAETAMSLLEEANLESGRNPESLLYTALAANRNGDTATLFSAMAEAIGKDPTYRIYFTNDPDFDGVRDHPEFQALVSEP